MTGTEEGGLPRRFAPRNDEGRGVFAMMRWLGFPRNDRWIAAKLCSSQ